METPIQLCLVGIDESACQNQILGSFDLPGSRKSCGLDMQVCLPLNWLAIIETNRNANSFPSQDQWLTLPPKLFAAIDTRSPQDR